MVIRNGRFQEDEQGEYTFHGSQGFSVIDYGICKLSDIAFISSFEVINLVTKSDHMPIKIALAFETFNEKKS